MKAIAPLLALAILAIAPSPALADLARHHHDYYKLINASSAGTAASGSAPSLQSYRFITDTLAPRSGGTADSDRVAAPRSYRFITDTLAPGSDGTADSDSVAAPQSYRFITDRLAPGSGATLNVIASSSGFSWADAGIGAGTGVGALLLLMGATLAVLHRRNRLAI